MQAHVPKLVCLPETSYGEKTVPSSYNYTIITLEMKANERRNTRPLILNILTTKHFFKIYLFILLGNSLHFENAVIEYKPRH